MIRYRNGAYEIVIHIGPDPVTGRERRKSQTIRMAEQSRIPRRVLDAEAALRLRVGRGDFGTPDLTVKDMLDAWLEHASPDLSPTTLHGYRKSIRLYLAPLERVKIAKLDPARIDRLYDSLRRDGKAPATIRQAHAILRRACDQAMRWGWLHSNPATLADPPPVKRADLHPPSRAEVAKLLATADDDLYWLILLAAGTGMRRGELCGVRLEDVGQGEIRVARSVVEIAHKLTVKSPKSGSGRTVAIGTGLDRALRARRAEMASRALRFGVGLDAAAYLLSDEPSGRAPLHPNLASDRFRRLARAQGIACRLHDLRHYYASRALDAGADAVAVAAQLGHASAKMTLDVYGHPTGDGQRRVAELLDAMG